MNEKNGVVRLTKDFLKEIDVKESDLQIKKSLGDKKREHEILQA